MQHKYNARWGLLYNGVNKFAYKLQCRHPRGFQWYSNAADGTQGYVCRDGCGQKCDFNPDYFMFQGNVRPLEAPNPQQNKTLPPLSEEGTKL